ncbi:MAG: superinfection immunity protein [bacterium]|nr:superinfection immunity protein [bacterium]
MDGPRGFDWLVIAMIAIAPALVPIVIAYARNTTNRTAVLVIALLTSWTCIGWAIAVAMASTGRPERPAP